MSKAYNLPELGNSPQEQTETHVDLKRIAFRAIPYWPLLLIMVILFVVGARFYIKYQVPIYKVTARVVVNDGEQEKGANLFQALTYKNVDKETERETEILQSKGLVTEVVRQDQLNVQWTKIGRVSKLPQFGFLPVQLWLASPDSVKKAITGNVRLLANGKIEYNGVDYITDSLIQSSFGGIKWHINNAAQFTNEWNLTILPISTTAGIFDRQLTATPINKQSSIINLTIVETVPLRGELFLNTLLDQYGKNNVAFKNRVYQNTVKFIEERLRIVSDELSGVESKLQIYKSKEGIVDLSAEGQLFLTQLKDADQKAGEIDIKLSVLKKIEEYVNSRNRNPESVPATLGLDDPILLSLLDQLYKAEFETRKMRELSGDKNPQLAVLEESLLKLKPSIIASIQNLRISLETNRQKLNSEGNQVLSHLKAIPQKERSLLEISRQQQIKNSIYTFLLQKREEAILSAAAQVPNYRVIDVPEFAGQVSPKPNLIYALAFSMATLLTLGFVYFKEFSNNKVLFSDDLTRITGVPLLGELAYSRRSEQNAVIESSERILISEQIRDLRTNLSYINVAKNGAQVLLITSSISGEGKSFLAVNLAAALARADKKVLLMECDLRKPAVCKKLGMVSGIGLTDYLIGTALLENIVRPVDSIKNVFLISSGPLPPNPVELLMNGKFQPVIEELKKQFDYIIIDAPPVAILTDAKVLAMQADSTLYVVRYNYTPAEFLDFIKDQVQRATLPRINLVFNGVVRKKMSSSGYGYGYGYAYGYVQEDEKSNRFDFFKKRKVR